MMLPASRWFLLIAVIAILAMVGLTLIGNHLESTIPEGSPQALRLAAFVRAADIGLLLLFAFAMVPPAIREGLRLFASLGRPRGADLVREARSVCRVADMMALGVWAVSAVLLAVIAPSLSDFIPASALLLQP